MPNNIIRQDYGTVGTDVQTQMLIAPVLAEMKADRQFAVGDQFIVDSVLYKITQTISVIGTPLVVGTNCAVSDSITQQIVSMMEGYKYDYIVENVTLTTDQYAVMYFPNDAIVLSATVAMAQGTASACLLHSGSRNYSTAAVNNYNGTVTAVKYSSNTQYSVKLQYLKLVD